jgi:hypothetical protein
MGLLDLKTDLKSLKYGGDRFGGGSSDQPYIQTDIDTGKLSISNSRGIGLLKPIETIANGVINTIGSLSKFVGNADDGFIRGGAVGAAQASTTDLLRIGKFFTDAPRGPLFIAKQVGLQLSNPRLEVKKGVRGVLSNILNLDPQGTVATLTGGLLQPTRIYNLGINTLAQVPVNAFGGHFTRHGLLPIQDDDSKYLSVVTSNNKPDGSPNNRLVGLTNQFKLGDKKPNTPPGLLGKIANLPFKIAFNLLKGTPLDIFKGEDIIDFYIGGPKSVYGIGTTTIRRYDSTEDKKRISDALEQASNKAKSAKIDWYYALGTQYPSYPVPNNEVSNPTSLAATIAPKTEILNPDVENQNVINYPAGSNTSKKYQSLIDAKNKLYQPLIDIPFSKAIRFDPSFGPFKSRYLSTYYGDDAIGLDRTPAPDKDGKQRFRYYGTPDYSNDGSQAKYGNSDIYDRIDSDILTVVFRIHSAFATAPDVVVLDGFINGYKDSFNSTWNEINYAGRAESLYIYNKFKRNVTFNIKIPSFSRKHLFEKHRALGQLAATTAGSYKNGFLGGVFIQLNVGNYLVGEYGILNSLDYSIPDEATWDITPEGRLSTLIEASFNFTIVHKELPQYEPAAGTNPGKAFFNYLPDGIKGFIQKGNRDQAEQKRINKLFQYDTYTPNADGVESKPKVVIGVDLEPEPNPLNSIKFPPIPTDDIFFDESSVVEIKNVAKKPFIGPSIPDGYFDEKDLYFKKIQEALQSSPFVPKPGVREYGGGTPYQQRIMNQYYNSFLTSGATPPQPVNPVTLLPPKVNAEEVNGRVQPNPYSTTGYPGPRK